MPKPITIIAAVAKNRVIGFDNKLLWHISADLKRYKARTLSKPVIMGRKTFESIVASLGRPLPGRTNIVLTRDADYAAVGAIVVPDVESALEAAEASPGDEIIINGGGEIYKLFLPQADALDITEVDLAPEGDAFFPEIDSSVWREASREAHPGAPGFAFVRWERG